ncbi:MULTISPECIES: penicillin-binding protein 1B [Methylophaga]|uniref:Penicillin-binding protein 1B n=1 Tax=Methylophaga marina TaxID=45495 RepID=A0ABN0TRE7_9GAMM
MAQKKAPSKKRTRSKKSPRRKKQTGFISRSSLLKIAFTLLVLLGLLTLFLDVQIRSQFEGKRWAVPAKVYARPLELYAGAPLSLSDLKIELKGLGYQFRSKAAQPGQAAFSSSKAIIATRGFRFSDGMEPARKLILDFNAEGVTRLRDYQGQDVPLVRLEPVLIGGIYPLNNEDRDLIQLKDAPPMLSEALIAIEDRDFYQHHGISPKGIARAMVANIKAGSFVQGGSTLTQQLIKNFYLTSDRSLVRKLLEIPMALLLELHYDKDDILEAYLNEVYLGQDGARAIHGFGLGAHYFFAQPLQELKLHQLALLAGLVKGPSYYDPRRHPERAKNRRNLVLKVLYEQDKITQQQYQQARNANLDVVEKGTLLKEAYPAFLDLVKRQLRRDYRDEDLNSEGLRVYTSLDPITQRHAESSLKSTIASLQQHHGSKLKSLQGSMVVTDPQTGEVLAVIGDKNTRYKGFNRALDSVRPIGSLVKPAVYLTALEQGKTLASMVDDSSFTLTLPNGQTWKPQNFSKQSHEDVLLIDALAHSYNIATVRLGMEAGLDEVINTLNRLGIKRQLDAYPSLLLGAQGLSPLEVATMYQTIAANGFQTPARAIRTVTDSQGEALSSYPFQLRQTIDADDVYLIQTAMQEVTHSGTAASIYSSLPSHINTAGKTGTTDDQRDSWFAGFSNNRLAVVWLGQDDNSPLPFTGSGGALRVWKNFMRSQPLESFEAPLPDDIKWLWIDTQTGFLSAQECEHSRQLPFISGTEPVEMSECVTQPGQQSNPVTRSLDWIKDWFQ